MLRNARVADAEKLGELPDRPFAFDQLADDEQAMPIGERLEQLACTVRRSFHDFDFYFHTCKYTKVRTYVKQSSGGVVAAPA